MNNLHKAAQAVLEALRVIQHATAPGFDGGGHEAAFDIASAAEDKLKAALAEPQPEQESAVHFNIMWTICRFALAYPTEALTHQIERFSEALHGKEQQQIQALLLRAKNPKPQKPATPLVPSTGAESEQEPVACDYCGREVKTQAQHPLTREQIDAIWSAQGSFTDRESDSRCFARAIERAHGIKRGE